MPAETSRLLDFIDALKGQGASDEFIVNLLRQNGWSERSIYLAFGAWYEARTRKTVPAGGGRIEAAKDAFLYLLSFITLGIWTIQLGSLLFTAIDRTFPNPALEASNLVWRTRLLADQLASVLVGFPLFLAVTAVIVRGVGRQPERLESSVRKWLTYIALVVTASIMIGDIVTFLAYFLRGDLDTRFVLKVLTVLVIAGVVFAYYLSSLRSGGVSLPANRLFAVAAVVLVGFGLAVGFTQIGSPAMQRAAAEDALRLSDLSGIAVALHAKWETHGKSDFAAPARIEDLQKASLGGARITDPATGRVYGYIPLQGTGYRLCAQFSLPSPAEVPAQWRHPAGSACFTLDAREPVDTVPRQW